MKNNLYKIEDIVKEVLQKDIESRSDDFVLIYRVYLAINENAVVRLPFYELMLNHNQYNLPVFESITRARRKVQKEHPELSNEKTVNKRLNATADYIDYAIDGYNPTFMKFVDSQE